MIRDSLAQQVTGKWVPFTVGLIVPRQNGKGSILEARELAGLFIFRERLILHSAHEFKTTEEHFLRMMALIEANPELDAEVKSIDRSKGKEGIVLKSGQRLRFVARTGGSGRGFTGDVVVLDEAYNLPTHVIAALIPTMSARPNPQLWYTSSPVNQEIHPYGLALSRVRRRAQAALEALERGEEHDEKRLLWMEWSGDEKRYLEILATKARRRAMLEEFVRDTRQHMAANPAYGVRIDGDFVQDELKELGPKLFVVERLGIGDWTPEPVEDDESLFDMAHWQTLIDRMVKTKGALTLAVDVSPDRKQASIAMCSYVDEWDDRTPVVEIKESGPGVVWLLDRLKDLDEKAGSDLLGIMVDPGAAAGSLIEGMENAGLPVVTVNLTEYAQACGDFYDRSGADGLLIHMGDTRLDAAMEVADWRTVREGKVWDRRETKGQAKPGNITPLVAASLALFGLEKLIQEQGVIVG